MADYKTHTILGSLLGGALTVLGLMRGWITLSGSVLALFFSVMASSLPDIDSDTGSPRAFSMGALEILFPALFFVSFANVFSLENLMIGMIGVFFAVRYVLGFLIDRLTKHRGAWHSIPAGLIVSLCIYLLLYRSDFASRIFYGSVVLVCFLFHLFLDEICSLKYFGLAVKKSFGSALKFGTGSWWLTFLLYSAAAGLLLLAVFENTAAVKE